MLGPNGTRRERYRLQLLFLPGTRRHPKGVTHGTPAVASGLGARVQTLLTAGPKILNLPLRRLYTIYGAVCFGTASGQNARAGGAKSLRCNQHMVRETAGPKTATNLRSKPTLPVAFPGPSCGLWTRTAPLIWRSRTIGGWETPY